MESSTHSSHRGYIFSLDRAPFDLAERLEIAGVAQISTRTVEGVYAEPTASLAAVMAAIEGLGCELIAVRPAHASTRWERPSEWRPRELSRLRNPLSPCWLPTAGLAA